MRLLQVVRTRADDAQLPFRIALGELFRDRDFLAPAQILPRDGLRVGLDLLRRTFRDQLAAVHASAGAHVDDVIRIEDRVFVVLDDDDRVADVAQLLQRRRASRRLSRWCSPMEGSSRMYMTPVSPDPTWLASRMRCASPPDSDSALPIQREVIEADVDEEAQAFRHVLHDLQRRLRRASLECSGCEKLRARGRP